MKPVSLPAGLFSDSRIRPIDIHVMGVLAIELSLGRTLLSYADLGRLTGYSRRVAVACVKRCQEAGWLRAEHTIDQDKDGPGPNRYEILWQNTVAGDRSGAA